jgi:hypothetical protein
MENNSIHIDTELYLYGRIVAVKETMDGKRLTLTQTERGKYKESYAIDCGDYQAPIVSDRVIGVRVKARQDIKTGAVTGLRLVEIIPYNPIYDRHYLEPLITRATRVWSDVDDVTKWVREIRSGAIGAK